MEFYHYDVPLPRKNADPENEPELHDVDCTSWLKSNMRSGVVYPFSGSRKIPDPTTRVCSTD